MKKNGYRSLKNVMLYHECKEDYFNYHEDPRFVLGIYSVSKPGNTSCPGTDKRNNKVIFCVLKIFIHKSGKIDDGLYLCCTVIQFGFSESSSYRANVFVTDYKSYYHTSWSTC